jgi:hypothetical protein
MSTDRTTTPIEYGQLKLPTTSTDTALVTLAIFAAFHQQVYPIIEKIVGTGRYKENEFVKKWTAATAQSSNKVTATTYFRTISKTFGMGSNDLSGYVQFLKTCPEIERHLLIFPSPSGSNSGFCYKVLMDEEQEEQPSLVAPEEVITINNTTVDNTTLETSKPNETDVETVITDPTPSPFYTCYNTDADFRIMFRSFWPSIVDFVANNTSHQHAQQWATWMDQGLNSESDLSFVKKLIGCESFDQLFLFFRDSPAIKPSFDLEWNHKINYQPYVGPKAFMVTPARTNKEKDPDFSSPESYHNTVSADPEDMNFRILHSKIFAAIQQWIKTTPSAHSLHHEQWHKWLWKGLKANGTFTEITRIIEVNNLQSYLDSMTTFPVVTKRFRFLWNDDSTKVYYSTDLTPTPPDPDSGDVVIAHFKKECQNFSNAYDAKLNSIKCGLYKLDEKIMSCEHTVNKHFEKYETYLKSVTSNILNEATAQLTGTVCEYVTTFKFQLNNTIQEQITLFETTLKNTIDEMIKDVYQAADDGHAAMKENHDQLIQELHETTQPAMEAKEIINDFLPHLPVVKNLLDQLANQRPPDSANQQQSNAPPMIPPTNTTQKAPRWGNIKVNHDFRPSANPWATPNRDNTTADQQDIRQPPIMHVHSTSQLPSIPPLQQQTNVQVIPPTATQPTNPTSTSGISHPRFNPIGSVNGTAAIPQRSSSFTYPDPTWVQQPYNIPTTVHVPSPVPPMHHYHDSRNDPTHAHNGLPPLNHDAAIKRVKIQYTGIGDMFVFYNQLLNALEQFGVFLMSLNQVQYNTSICPTTYNGFAITAQRYDSMAKTLYQKLQNPDVIPMEHTSIRNIINRFAEVNDGYQVLYAMLELVHPVLHEDAVLLPPKSSDCQDDIHLYAHKFDSWLRYETYANRLYSPREQVNCFIRELSTTFAPAVSRIRRLLDTWQPYDTNTPNALQLKQLPNTIERYMMEETGNNIWILRIGDRNQHSDRDSRHQREGKDPVEKDKDKLSKDSRQVQDIYCSLCGGYGHPDTQCDFGAKFIKTQESLKNIDQKRKVQIQANFRQEQQKCRARRLKKKVGTIRQMLYSGADAQDVDTLLESLPDLIAQQDDNSTSERSSTSSSEDEADE